MIKDHLPEPNDDTLILMCGPPPMINFLFISFQTGSTVLGLSMIP